MTKLSILVALLLGTPFLQAADQVLINPERGELQIIEDKVVFRPKESIYDRSEGGFFYIVSGGGVLLSAGLQDTKAYRPNEKIIRGGIGNYNVGGAAPCSGIPVFIATGNQRPRLVGITDANGSFAVKLPQLDNASEIFIFFGGAVEALDASIPDGQIIKMIHNDIQNLVLKVGESTARYRVSIPNAEQAGSEQPATRPESKSEGDGKPQPESEGSFR